jgi:prepilin-type N-terminal cleavage/methylation domain-containing protein
MRPRRGFTLIELLIAVAIIAIIAAIAISNYYNALHRAKQKRTMADIRGIAVAWEARAVDVKQYNASGLGFTLPAATIGYGALETLLAPTYIRNIPSADGWGNPLEFRLDQAVGSAVPAAEYAIRSPGRDGRYQSTYLPGATSDFDCDIVYSNGSFVVWPEGAQQK